MPMDGAGGVLGLAAALAAIVLLALARRMIGRGDARRAPREDFGLLRAAAVADDRAGAEVVRGLLAAAGIRATVAGGAGPGVRVLVFAEDLVHARAVVSGPM